MTRHVIALQNFLLISYCLLLFGSNPMQFMSTAESVLLCAAVIVSVAGQWWIKSIKPPVGDYLKWFAAASLLVMVWLFSDARLSFRLIITAVMVSATTRSIREFVVRRRDAAKGEAQS